MFQKLHFFSSYENKFVILKMEHQYQAVVDANHCSFYFVLDNNTTL